MELRDIEIFLTLAEELHFGRTAERLHVSVAAVSKALKKQERAIGVELFARNSRNVRLTPVGEQLRDDLRELHQGLTKSLERARLAARGKTGTLRVSLFPVNIQEMRRYWETFRSRHPQWELRLRVSAYPDPFAQLRDGEVDVLVTWPPEEPDLTVGPLLFAEPRVLAMAEDNNLATWSTASIEAVGDYRHVIVESVPGDWMDRYVPKLTPKGRPIERTAVVHNIEDILLYTTMGETISLFPAHVTRYYPRPGIVYRPVTDMEPLPYALVWRSDAENDMIRALARVVREVGPLPGWDH
ncbi:LysR family transcriptional regulator [Sphaerisporangium krabiense]|uniref:DNA-binding transcriptional LysR family regulator n=1 Tax=Sphaerisporangium krabiense TaxID=763782 RepID=A0A7W9DVI4_9ACTN|nr:LysR family transcriptional regulator [Sphaerisporangium krabiense]MBB5631495.1 DNA-binding transcriptional LysR family regulator [Sphaerisporangium krabiense]GII60910.1 LysR family transcriptional regulator [Sphaerisporangium krabiense]